jgi:signal transduction histidine kinase/ActR/RegA family two-component response regulator
MILVSWGAGAVSTSATVIRAFAVYAALLFVPTAAIWLLSGNVLGLAVGALVLMFFGVQWRFAQRNLDTFDESFRIRLENDALARSLQGERSQLAAARDGAVQANQEKSRFLAAASHDLRQPLQAMSLNVGALERMAIAGEAGIVVGEVAASLDQLRSMLDALLDLSKLDAGMVMPQLRSVQLDRLLSAVSSTFRAVADGRGLSLQCECPDGLVVRTDPELLRRMLANLLDNAIKFTAQGGVEVRATATESQVEISVRDSGPGIAPEHHRQIFEDLVQLQRSAVTGPHGHGLGLGIVRRLAKLLQVQVTLQSAPGHGATFRLVLPHASGASSAACDAEPSTSPWSIADCSVLVLDDDPMVRGAYMHALTAMGCHSVAAATIDDALQQLEVRDVQAAVVDYQLASGPDGFDAIVQLRDRHAQLPAVMVTASLDPSIREIAQRHGVRLLRKPVDARSLGQALAQVLGREAPHP